MRKFSKRDLDRSWSPGEVGALSEGELTKLAFLRDYKNFLFLVPAAYVLYLIGGVFGVSGKIVGWAGVAMFGAFALQALLNTALTIFSLVGTPILDKVAPVKTMVWKSLQFFLSLGNLLIDVALAFLVYAGMYDLKLRDYMPW